jgi:pimeloyl-ACP methyl ester carboxylesterase
MSQGAPISIQYAVRHPERVTHLIICGGFARGFLHRDDVDHQKQSLELSRALIRQGWGSGKEAYRQWFTSQFIPEATAEQSRCFNEAEQSQLRILSLREFVPVYPEPPTCGSVSRLFSVDFKPGLRNFVARVHEKSAVNLRDF